MSFEEHCRVGSVSTVRLVWLVCTLRPRRRYMPHDWCPAAIIAAMGQGGSPAGRATFRRWFVGVRIQFPHRLQYNSLPVSSVLFYLFFIFLFFFCWRLDDTWNVEMWRRARKLKGKLNILRKKEAERKMEGCSSVRFGTLLLMLFMLLPVLLKARISWPLGGLPPGHQHAERNPEKFSAFLSLYFYFIFLRRKISLLHWNCWTLLAHKFRWWFFYRNLFPSGLYIVVWNFASQPLFPHSSRVSNNRRSIGRGRLKLASVRRRRRRISILYFPLAISIHQKKRRAKKNRWSTGEASLTAWPLIVYFLFFIFSCCWGWWASEWASVCSKRVLAVGCGILRGGWWGGAVFWEKQYFGKLINPSTIQFPYFFDFFYSPPPLPPLNDWHLSNCTLRHGREVGWWEGAS